MRVSVAGSPLQGEQAGALTRVHVDLDVDLFGQCALVFNDPHLKLINGKQFESGTAVKVELGFGAKKKQVFEGEVVALEPQFRRDLPPSLRVVCQESLHRLALSSMTRAFNDVDDKEIVSQIAREHGLSADAPGGSKTHQLQANVTDAAYLRRIARAHGNHLRIEGTKLVVGPPKKGAQLAIGPGSGITKAKVRISSNAQVNEVSVHGWDPKQKKEIVAKAKSQGELGEGGAKHAKGTTLAIAGHEPAPTDTATAEAMAKGRLRILNEGFIKAQIDMIGDADLVPGAEVKIEKLSPQLDGTWRVEHATHELSKHGYFVRWNAVRIAKAQPRVPKETLKEQKDQQKVERDEPPKDKHIVSAEVKGLGGTPLPHHLVRILDPDTGKQVGEVAWTDENGLVTAEVPANKKYRIELVDDRGPEVPAPPMAGEEKAVLACHFVDASGHAVSGEKVTLKTGDDELEVTTDDAGRITVAAHLAGYELKIKDHTFHAHGLPAGDHDKPYLFMVRDDLRLIAVEVKGLGDTPLVNHPVRVIDPDSGEAVTDVLTTDDKGVVHAEVPEDKPYRIEILDDEAGEHPPVAIHGDDGKAKLVADFVDAAGLAVAHEKISAKLGDDVVELTTDANGHLEVAAQLGAYELTIGDQKFQAHGAPADDPRSAHVFVVTRDTHVIAVEAQALGGVVLANTPVQIVDPESNEVVGETVSDDKGIVRAEVPEPKPYRIAIVAPDDEAPEAPGAPVHGDAEPAVLVCEFLDDSGAPLAAEKIMVGDVELTTDADGRLEAAMPLAGYTLTVRGQTFQAHAVPAADKDRGTHRFVLTRSS